MPLGKVQTIGVAALDGKSHAVVTDGGPGRSTQTLAYFVYETAFNYYDMGYAAAAAYILTAVLLVASGFYLRLVFKK